MFYHHAMDNCEDKPKPESPITLKERSNLGPELSRQQGSALVEEISSTRNLLAASVTAIRDMRYISEQGDAVFTLGSIGVEKAMKLMLGCNEVAVKQKWPAKNVLQKWGHDIERLNSLLSESIRNGLPRCGATGYSERLAKHIGQSDILPLLFATFARYGKSGRFHQLDILATDKPASDDSPHEYWNAIEAHLRETRSEFRQIPYNDNDKLDDYEKRLRGRIADELDAWWFCLHRLGIQGCFGDLGKQVGCEIWPPDRQKPRLLQDL